MRQGTSAWRNGGSAMTTISWKTAGSGLWASAANWSPAQIPGAADTALIDGVTSYLISISGATVGSIQLNNPAATLLSGGTVTIDNSLNVTSGTLDIAGTALVMGGFINIGTIVDTGFLGLFGNYDAASLQLIGGTGGTLALAGSLFNAGGTFDGSGLGGLRVTSLGTVHGGVITGLRQPGGATLDGVTWRGPLDAVNSLLTVKNGLVATSVAGTGAGSISVGGGTLDFQGDQTLDNLHLTGNGLLIAENTLTLGANVVIGPASGSLAFTGRSGDGEIINEGLISVVGHTLFPGDFGISAYISVGDFENDGTVETVGTAGTASDSYIVVSSGTFTNHPGGLVKASDSLLRFANSSVLTNDGTITADAGSIVIGGLLLGSGRVIVTNGATVELANAAVASETFDLSGSVTLRLDQPAFFGRYH